MVLVVEVKSEPNDEIWDRKGRGNKTLEDSRVKPVKRVKKKTRKMCFC
jgi:hypothetical protein